MRIGRLHECRDSGEVPMTRDLARFIDVYFEMKSEDAKEQPSRLGNKRTKNVHIPTVVPAECMV